MAIGIVSDEEFNKEVQVIHHNGLGRNGVKEVPEAMRKVIAETAILSNNNETARAFGVSPQSVEAYKNGATSLATYNKPDPNLKKHVDEVRATISGIAKSKMLEAMEHITAENLSRAKPRDLAGIAKDMSTVVNNMEPSGPQVQNNSQFIFHTYGTQKEEDYEVLDVVDVR